MNEVELSRADSKAGLARPGAGDVDFVQTYRVNGGDHVERGARAAAARNRTRRSWRCSVLQEDVTRSPTPQK